MEEYIHDLLSFNFNGRMNRSRYWMTVLYGFVLSIAISIVLNTLGLENTAIGGIINFAFCILCLPFTVRRLHDLNKSGWWYLVFLIPIIGFFFFFYFGFFKGTDGPNAYGPDPLR